MFGNQNIMKKISPFSRRDVRPKYRFSGFNNYNHVYVQCLFIDWGRRNNFSSAGIFTLTKCWWLAVWLCVEPPVVVVALVDMSKQDLPSVITISREEGYEMVPQEQNLTCICPELSAWCPPSSRRWCLVQGTRSAVLWLILSPSGCPRKKFCCLRIEE